MLTVVINHSYIRHGCRDGYVFWIHADGIGDRDWAQACLPDWNDDMQGETRQFITDDGKVMSNIAVQVINGHTPGVFLSPDVYKLPTFVRAALTPKYLAAILKACEDGCQKDWPEPPASEQTGDESPVGFHSEHHISGVATPADK